MPCTYFSSPAEEAAYAIAENNKKFEVKIKELKNQLDLATRLLCDICSYTESANIRIFVDETKHKELDKWWQDHKQRDAARIEAEKKAKEKKLTEKKIKRKIYELEKEIDNLRKELK